MREYIIMKGVNFFFVYFTALGFGVICLCLTYVASLLGNILQVCAVIMCSLTHESEKSGYKVLVFLSL